MEMPGNEVTFELLKEFAAQTTSKPVLVGCRDVQCRWLPGLSCSATTLPVPLQPNNQVQKCGKQTKREHSQSRFLVACQVMHRPNMMLAT